MKRRVFATALTMSMVMGLAACGGSSNAAATTAAAEKKSEAAATTAAAAEKTTEAAKDASKETKAEGAVTGTKQGETVLKCAFNQSAENPEAETVRRMSDELYDATSGRYSIEVYPNELLGNQADSLQSVEVGAIDMALVANSIVEGVNPDFAIIGTPYIYDSVEQQQKLFKSGALDDLFASTESAGFRCLAAYSLGPRNVYSRDGAITTPEELSGKKIRVMQSDTMIQMMNAMGGVGTPMSQGDVYSAIQTKTLDGAENNIITYIDLKQYEVAPYYNETGHLMIPDELVISADVMNTMSAEDQEALKKVAANSIDTAFKLCGELREKYYKQAAEFGVTVTKVDIAPFQKNCQSLIDSVANRSETTKKIYKALKEIK